MDHLFDKIQYIQDANFEFLDRPVNIFIGKKAPNIYLKKAKKHCMNA